MSEPVHPNESRRAELVDEIRRRIIEGELEDGSRLDERELANQFGVSRVPVREAILLLAGEGMVELRRHHGAFVAPLDYHVVRDLFEIRGALEPLGAYWCALRASKEDIDLLDQLTEVARQAEESNDHSEGSGANTAFHETLFRASGNQLLVNLIPSVVGITRRVFRKSIVDHESMMWREHREIVRAIQRGDADEAARLTVEHLEHTRRHTFEIFEGEDN